MTFIELGPRWDGDYLAFECPKCRTHDFLLLHNGKSSWTVTGRSFETISVSPIVVLHGGCNARFSINDGQVLLH